MTEFDNTIAREHEKKRAQLKTLGIVITASIVLLAVLYFGGKVLFNASDNAATNNAEKNGENAAISSENALNSQERAALREQAQAALSETRQRINALNERPAFTAYLGEQYSTLQDSLEAALAAYTSTQYSAALAYLADIQQQLAAAEQRYQQAYEQAYAQAEQAFAIGNIDTARQANSDSLELNPEYEPALALQNRINVFADVNDLMRQAEIAMVENDLEKQRGILQQVLLLDAEQTEARDLLQSVEQELTEQAFTQAIQRALAFLDNGELNQAETAVNQANQLINNRSEVTNLRMRIQTERTALELSSIEQQLNVFKEADEWPTVVMIANNALQKHPAHEASQQALELGSAVTQLHSRVMRYIEQPDRLSDLTVLQNAEQVLLSARVFAGVSPKLARSVNELEDVIEVANTPVAVLLRSDNETFVRVLGVGNVGAHEEYQFQLKPGVYQFEGRRSGYRSKIITVTVAPSETPLEVRLVADERI